ncbi:MAG: hypothetical protein A3G76_08770 [Acidobacteria bacterium RIFCSPLOWO2_12_FULL_65_11]|nr:MAG: hypothetical protein A3H95_12375 [Acidobacteria bacterium RIFCSPLOWO2_02_FULL_64_15]OFW29821.1 MAG: hypothetical protein A3G76_08770 [Acidobacteria bacterium RIFCSPLOWO2_12_FULL_65_11]
MRPRSLVEFLKDARVPYTTFRHRAAFTAEEEADVSHVPGRSWAKVVFNAGTHTDAIRMHWGDLADVVRPVVGVFARPPARL